ncbi:MAG: guanitoxin biosynthesis heme-dependent pre-guanitoxin N-hydroxylase GntA [Chthoniobacterales bacterium]
MRNNPFGTDTALLKCNPHFTANGELNAHEVTSEVDSFIYEAHRKFKQWVMDPEFPCLGAKAAFNDETYAFAVYSELASSESTAGLCRDLIDFREYKRKIDNRRENRYATFVAVFRGPCGLDEAQFEELLWRQLRQLHRADVCEWYPDASADPSDPHFSFSFAGQAFYIVGMHANSSRIARRFPWPALIFNPHEQFEQLRADGKWRRMQETIRARDVALQGSVNPMLNDFGEASEARQYSGRAVPDDWKAPFPNANGKCPFGH